MPDRRVSHMLIYLSVIMGIVNVCGPMIQIGALKGEITQRVADHESRLLRHQEKIEVLSDGVSDLKARIHGVATQIGKVPSKVAERFGIEARPALTPGQE